MLSEFGRPFDVELTGHGFIGLTAEQWGLTFRLAKAFGWCTDIFTPVSQDAPAKLNMVDDRGVSVEIHQINSVDAGGLALALGSAIRAWETELDLTASQTTAIMPVPRGIDSFIVQVAGYAAKGEFQLLMRA